MPPSRYGIPRSTRSPLPPCQKPSMISTPTSSTAAMWTERHGGDGERRGWISWGNLVWERMCGESLRTRSASVPRAGHKRVLTAAQSRRRRHVTCDSQCRILLRTFDAKSARTRRSTALLRLRYLRKFRESAHIDRTIRHDSSRRVVRGNGDGAGHSTVQAARPRVPARELLEGAEGIHCARGGRCVLFWRSAGVAGVVLRSGAFAPFLRFIATAQQRAGLQRPRFWLAAADSEGPDTGLPSAGHPGARCAFGLHSLVLRSTSLTGRTARLCQDARQRYTRLPHSLHLARNARLSPSCHRRSRRGFSRDCAARSVRCRDHAQGGRARRCRYGRMAVYRGREEGDVIFNSFTAALHGTPITLLLLCAEGFAGAESRSRRSAVLDA